MTVTCDCTEQIYMFLKISEGQLPGRLPHAWLRACFNGILNETHQKNSSKHRSPNKI